MIIRALTTSGDWTFGAGQNNYLQGNAAIALNIQTRLLSFQGDAFFDMTAGINWTARLDTGQQANLEADIKTLIQQSYGVVGVTAISYVYNAQNRIETVNATINTIYTQGYITTFNLATGNNAQSS